MVLADQVDAVVQVEVAVILDDTTLPEPTTTVEGMEDLQVSAERLDKRTEDQEDTLVGRMHNIIMFSHLHHHQILNPVHIWIRAIKNIYILNIRIILMIIVQRHPYTITNNK